jgi:predicted nucleic acid-binding protein
MKAMIDTNVLLDVLLPRQPWDVDAKAVWDAVDAGKCEGLISSLSLPNIFYIARKIVGLEKAHAAMTILLEAFEIIPIERLTLEAAVALPGNDFEDKLQIASAISAAVDHVITRDPRGFAASPVTPLSPAEFLLKLTGQPPATP